MNRRLTKNFLYALSGIFLLTLCACTSMAVMQVFNENATEEDWPQFKKDNYRSGYTDADIDLAHFGKTWVYDTGQEPIPAWYGPAKEDAYARSGPLPSMRDYDLAYYPIIVGDYLYYGSSADDAVHCHNARTSQEIWHFTTGAPIRIAPTFYEGKIYVGSDDGFVYCLNAKTGHLIWKFSATPKESQRLLNNGRFISFYPVRTGVMIEDGIAYFGASLLPWKKSYVCAVDAENGEVGKEGTYVKEYNTNSMTLEGAMASTGKMLIQPQGRIAPVFIRKENGETAGSLPGTGGCFVLVTPDKSVVHGESSRYISMEETKMDEKQAKLMSYNDGKEIIVKGDSSYVLNENSLVSYSRITQHMNWLRQNFRAQRIIIAGDVLFAGGDDKVEGISLKNGQTIWESKVSGTVYALSFARGCLYASTNEGIIYAFAPNGDDAHYYPEKEKLAGVVDEKPKQEEKDKTATLKPCLSAGPYIQPFSADSVELTFETYEPMSVSLEWHINAQAEKYTANKATVKHSFRIPVRKGKNYDYRLSSTDGKSAVFNYDNFFNFYTRTTKHFPKAPKSALHDVKKYLKKYPAEKGLCLVYGKHADESALALAAETPLHVVCVQENAKEYQEFVETLQKRHSYSRKLNGLKVDRISEIPVISEIADLVWVNNGDDHHPDEVIRLVAPNKYAVITNLGHPKEWLEQSTLDWQVTVMGTIGDLFILKKNPFENIGVWSHQHGDLRNASYGGESLFGNTETSDFETQWMGRPGARFITDRSGRKPAPLAIDGRIFMQGKERIAAFSVFNGSLLWMKDVPGLLRMNIPRDCSNWACDNNHLYVATRQHLLKIDQHTGNILSTIDMKCKNDASLHWGFVGVLDKYIMGSTTKPTAQYTNYHGYADEGWYDTKEGPNAYKVISQRLFLLNKSDHQLKWEYLPKGAIINATICVHENRILFVESLSVNKESMNSGRGGNDLYAATRLIALDVNTGKKLYEKPFRTQEGRAVYYMASGSGKCVVVSSFDGFYDVVTFDVSNGEQVWTAKQKWFHIHHGQHMSKPAIAGDRLVIKPEIYNLHTGEVAGFNTPKAGHGCAHYALSDHAIFYRGASCTIFDFDTRLFSKWERLRPDCWLSTIPAQGMVLSPEAAGGCSCGLWYETSMVFAPKSRTPVAIIAHTDDSKKTYKDETWGEFTSNCNTNRFTDNLVVELKLKPGMEYPIYYTLDGSEPTKSSAVYKGPITLTESAEVKVAVYIQKAGKERRFTRAKSFERVNKK